MSVTVYYQHITKENIKGKCSLEEWIAFKARPKGIGRLYKEIGRDEKVGDIIQPARPADFTQEVRGFVPPEALEAVEAAEALTEADESAESEPGVTDYEQSEPKQQKRKKS